MRSGACAGPAPRPARPTVTELGGHRVSARESAIRSFEQLYSRPPTAVSRAPGRVSLIGGHVDYNDGLVLPVAVERMVRVAFRPRDDRTLRLHSEAFAGGPSILDLEALHPDAPPADATDREARDWTAYPLGVARALDEADHAVCGLDAVVRSDLPIGAGLGSSAALEVAFAAAFRHATDLEIPDDELARICLRAENEFVGVRCGIMDQLASACTRAGHALLIDCVSHATRQVPIPEGLRLVVLDTGVARELRSSAFNRRRRESAAALERIAALDPAVRSYRDLGTDDLDRFLPELPSPLAGRARHVVTEIERVRAAADALQAGDLSAVGQAMFASHASSREDYETSCEELDALVELAAAAPGIIGARLTGAGFGGCTVNLVVAGRAGEFTDRVSTGYERRFGRRPAAFVSRAAAGVSVEPLGGDGGRDADYV